jgi:cytochrome b561
VAQTHNLYPSSRYSNVSIFLHWTIAALIVLNIALGWVMMAGEGAARTPFALHQSVGVAILLLSFMRLGWRLTHPWLPLPTVMLGWEKALARTTHILFYVAIIGIPLLDYLAMSAPADTLSAWHVIAAFATVGLLLLHIGAALKHSYIQRNRAQSRTVPLKALDVDQGAQPNPLRSQTRHHEHA